MDSIRSNSTFSTWIDAASARPVSVITFLLFVGFTLLRLPFRSHFPVNWDAVQLALGTQSFNLHHHQPHPPGYVGFIGLGRLVNFFTGDPNTSLTILSIIGGSLAPALLFIFAMRFMSRGYALLTAILFGLSPLIWYYSEVALTYAAEAAVGIAFLAVAHRAMRNGSTRDLIVATILLSAVGSLRQSAMLFLIPVWLYVVWQYPWSARIRSVVVMGITSALWVGPLLWLSGGPAAYMRESRALANLIGGQTSILSMNFEGIQANVNYIVAGVLIGVNVGLLIVAAALLSGVRPLKRFSKQDRIFLGLWIAPALAIFLLGHTGQLGYILLLLPALFILTGVCLEQLSIVSIRNRSVYQRALVVAGTAIFALVSTIAFTSGPGMAYSWARPAEGEQVSSTARHLLQYDIESSNDHWRSFNELVRGYDPERTVLLTTIGGPKASGSFRHASYLLPEYRVHGLGHDIADGSFGYLFTAQNGVSDYSVAGLETSLPWLPIESGARWVIIPDTEIVSRLGPGIDQRTITLSSGAEVVIAYIPPRTAITLDAGTE